MMKFARTIKVIMLNALVAGGLIGVGMPMQVQAAQQNDGGETIALVGDNSSSHAAKDEFVDEGSTDEEAAGSSQPKPEYKYVPVRRY